MTTDELNTIVAAVVAELEKSGVDFDYKADQAKDDDLVFVIRGTAPNYQGVTVTWKGLLDIITAQATQAKNDAETAKNAANTILEQVQSKGTEITNFVATSKTEIETQKNESVNAVKSVYQTDLDELKGDLASKVAKELKSGYVNYNTDGAITENDSLHHVEMKVSYGISVLWEYIYSLGDTSRALCFFDENGECIVNYKYKATSNMQKIIVPFGAKTVKATVDNIHQLKLCMDAEDLTDIFNSMNETVSELEDTLHGEIESVDNNTIRNEKKIEKLSEIVTIEESDNKFNKSDDSIIRGKYILHASKTFKDYDYTFVSHPIEVVDGKIYFFPLIRSDIGSEADYLYKCDENGNIIDSIYCENNNNSYVEFQCTFDGYIIFVGKISKIDECMFIESDGYPTTYIGYNYNQYISIDKIDGYKNPTNEYCGTETKDAIDLYNNLKYSSNNHIVVDDGTAQFKYGTFESGSYKGMIITEFNLKNGEKVNNVKTVPACSVYDKFVYPLYIDDIENVEYIVVQIGSDASNKDSISPTNVSYLKNGWNLINTKRQNVIGTVDENNVVRVEINFKAKEGCNVIVKIGNIASYSRMAMCSIWFDDGLVSCYENAFPYLKDKNILSAMSVIPSCVGDNNFMTKSQLIEMKNEGWDLCNHTYFAETLTDFDVNKAEYSIVKGKEYLESIGVGNSKNYLVLPLGEITEEQKEMAMKHSTMIRYAGAVHTSIYNCNMPYDDWYNVPCYSVINTMTVDTVKGIIDDCIYNEKWFCLLWHSFVETPSSVKESYVINDFKEIIDYLYSKQSNGELKLVTPSEAIMSM